MVDRIEQRVSAIEELFSHHELVTFDLLLSAGIASYDRGRLSKADGPLERVAVGVYKRRGRPMTLPGAVRYLTDHVGLRVHIGARTAPRLTTSSFPLKSRKYYLFCDSPERVPLWFKKLDCFSDSQPSYRNLSRFDDNILGIHSLGGMFVSEPERALLEQLVVCLWGETLEDSYTLVAAQKELRPKLMQYLLEHCTSIKAKRLLLYMADKASHAWLHELDQTRIDLGSGARNIVKGGVFNAKYQISLPESLEPRKKPEQ